MTRAKRARRRVAELPPFVEADLVAEAPKLTPTFLVDDLVVDVLRLVEAGARHPVLVGPHDSGKSALVRAIAMGIAEGARPSGAQALWRVSMRAIDLATHKDMGLVPALAQVVRDAAHSRLKPLLWIPDVHLARAFDTHAVLALLLERSGVRMIAEALPPFDRQCAEDVELASFLHPLRMPVKGERETAELLGAYREWLGAVGRPVRKAAVSRALALAARAFPSRALPGRAFHVLGLALEASDPSRPLTAADVSRSLERTVDLPLALLDGDADALRAKLESTVVGQRDATAALGARFALWRARATTERRPAAMVLLAGPPGVGKSHIAREFARATLGRVDRLVTIRGGEYVEDWKVDQLLGQIGASSGELRRGTLARSLAGDPFSVVLVDEIERANPLLLRWLLQIADEGAYVNGADERVSLENVFVIITSNAGGDAYRERPLGIGPEGDVNQRVRALQRSMAATLPPELFERVDRVVLCGPLSLASRVELVQRWIRDALRSMRVHGAAPSVEGVDPVAEKIAEPALDARALRARLDEMLLGPLAALPANVGALRARVRGESVELSAAGEEAP